MRRNTKLWLLSACILIVLGCCILAGALWAGQWDTGSLSTAKYVTNAHTITQEFEDLTIITDTADVTLIATKDAEPHIVCYEQEHARHHVSVKDGTLTIEVQDTRKWYEYVGIHLDSPRITMYIPCGGHGALDIKTSTGDIHIPSGLTFDSIHIAGSTGDVTNLASSSGNTYIQTSTGSIHVENISTSSIVLKATTGNIAASNIRCAGSIQIGVSTGKTQCTNAQCSTLTTTGSTGDITLRGVIAEQDLTIERTTGDVELDRCDAAQLRIQTDTGDVTGSICTEKIFTTETDTGDVHVPQCSRGGKCEISTDTGDIQITIAES